MAPNNEDFVYRILTEDDFESVWSILGEEFILSEPVAVKLELNPKCPHLVASNGGVVKQALKQHASIGAFRKDAGAIVGFAILRLSKYTNDNAIQLDTDDSSLAFRQLHALLNTCYDAIPGAVGGDDYMDVSFLSCRRDCSGHGIGTTLFERALEMARQKECKRVIVVAFNYFVQRIAEKLGFTYVKKTPYSDYIDPVTGDKVLDGMPKPQCQAAVMMKTLT